jgi:hypothetical protein
MRAAADVDDALARAAGSNYDAGNTAAGVRAGGSSSLKSASKTFFQQKDAETEIKGIQFTKARAGACVTLTRSAKQEASALVPPR